MIGSARSRDWPLGLPSSAGAGPGAAAFQFGGGQVQGPRHRAAVIRWLLRGIASPAYRQRFAGVIVTIFTGNDTMGFLRGA